MKEIPQQAPAGKVPAFQPASASGKSGRRIFHPPRRAPKAFRSLSSFIVDKSFYDKIFAVFFVLQPASRNL